MGKEDYSEIRKFLDGHKGWDDRGLPKTSYLSRKQEAKGRFALAALLRSNSPLPQDLRDFLASLFDEDTRKWPFTERILVLRFRARGRRQDGARSTRIGEHVRMLVVAGTKHEAAFQSAMSKFRLSRSQVLSAWRVYLTDCVELGVYDPRAKQFRGSFNTPIG